MRDLEVFAQAIEIEDEDKRAKYVLAACGSDSALRAEVMRLLDSYSRADSLLETQPVGDQFADQLLGQFESSTQGARRRCL